MLRQASCRLCATSKFKIQEIQDIQEIQEIQEIQDVQEIQEIQDVSPWMKPLIRLYLLA